jgi:homoserine dehydrogenase
MTGLLTSTDALAADIYGCGQVARALLQRLDRAAIHVASLHDSKGVRQANPVPDLRRVIVDATSPKYSGVQAREWVAVLERHLEKGTPVVTCNKAPLATHGARLQEAAQRGKSAIWASACVGGGTPLLLTLGRLQASHGIASLEASLSGTLAYVLSRIAGGSSLDDAVAAAQRAGYAEPNPQIDLDGTDAYAKAVILHNRLWPQTPNLTVQGRRGELRLDEDRVRAWACAGLVPQVVARVRPGEISLDLEGRSAKEALPSEPAFAAVRARLSDGAIVEVAGPGAGPGLTAGALLSDLLDLRDRGIPSRGTVLP